MEYAINLYNIEREYNCNYLKGYCVIDEIPNSIYHKIVLNLINSIFIDSIKDYEKNIDVTFSYTKFGKYKFCVIEMILDKNLRIIDVKKMIDRFVINMEKLKLISGNNFLKDGNFFKIDDYGNNFLKANNLLNSKLYNCEIDGFFNYSKLNEMIDKIMERTFYWLGSGFDEINHNIINFNRVKNVLFSPDIHKKNIKICNSVDVGSNVIVLVSEFIGHHNLGNILSIYLSKILHTKVREERGLSYYVSCIYDRFESSISVVAATKNKRDLKNIENIIKDFNNHKISKNELNESILQWNNEILSIKDEPFSNLSYEFENILYPFKNRNLLLVDDKNFNNIIERLVWDIKVYIKNNEGGDILGID